MQLLEPENEREEALTLQNEMHEVLRHDLSSKRITYLQPFLKISSYCLSSTYRKSKMLEIKFGDHVSG